LGHDGLLSGGGGGGSGGGLLCGDGRGELLGGKRSKRGQVHRRISRQLRLHTCRHAQGDV
jgi:hypothetical protein